MADIPKCPNPECPRSQVILLGEAPENWQFGCQTCRSPFVRSKPAFRLHVAKKMKRENYQPATQAERAKFYAPKGGWRLSQ